MVKLPTGGRSSAAYFGTNSNYESHSPKFVHDVADRGVLSGGPSSMRSSAAGTDFRKMFSMHKQTGDDDFSSHESGETQSDEGDASTKMQAPVSTIIMSYTKKKKRDDIDMHLHTILEDGETLGASMSMVNQSQVRAKDNPYMKQLSMIPKDNNKSRSFLHSVPSDPQLVDLHNSATSSKI